MLRYMLCPVLFDGVDSYRAAVSDVPETNSAAVIPTNLIGTPQTNPDYGKPKYGFCLCAVSSNNWPAVLAVSNSYAFPVYNLDGRMDGMESEARTGMVQTVQAYNLDGNGLNLDASHNDADSYRSLMQSLLHQFEPAYNFNAFSVSEVASQ